MAVAKLFLRRRKSMFNRARSCFNASVKIITDERCTGYSRAGHPEQPRRVANTVARLQSQTELPLAWVAPSENIPDEIILRAHAPEVLTRLAVPEEKDRMMRPHDPSVRPRGSSAWSSPRARR